MWKTSQGFKVTGRLRDIGVMWKINDLITLYTLAGVREQKRTKLDVYHDESPTWTQIIVCILAL